MPDLTLIEREGFWIREAFAEQDLVIVHDIYRDDAYRLALIAERVQEAQLVIDVGAHIGCFARLVHELAPSARVICVEACRTNLAALEANVAGFAQVVWAACSYDRRPLSLWNAFTEHGCESTGGSQVRWIEEQPDAKRYRWDGVSLPKVTIEELAAFHGHRVDLLKLDCEGSEFSILANCDLESIGFIVGEYHGRQAWDLLREWRLPDWDYGHMSAAGDLGNFHLKNPRWPDRTRVDPSHRLRGPHFPPQR